MAETTVLRVQIEQCPDHPAQPPCYVRGLFVLTERGLEFAYHGDGIMPAGQQIICGFQGCRRRLSIRQEAAG